MLIKRILTTLFLLIIFTGNIYSNNTNLKNIIINSRSVDLGLTNYYPMGRYRDFSKANLGVFSNLNLELFRIKPLRIFPSISIAGNLTNNDRLTEITDISLSLGAGFQFNIPNSPIAITPMGSYGWMIHITKGDFYGTGSKNEINFFSDSIISINLEVEYKPLGVFITPGFIMFSEQDYWGYELGINIGYRYNLKTNI